MILLYPYGNSIKILGKILLFTHQNLNLDPKNFIYSGISIYFANTNKNNTSPFFNENWKNFGHYYALRSIPKI